MDAALFEVEHYAQIALTGASAHGRVAKLRVLRHRYDTATMYWKLDSKIEPSLLLEKAIVRTIHFYNQINRTILYLLRQFEMTQGYRDMGFNSLTEWALATLARLCTPDKIRRMCAITTKVIAALDAAPEIDPRTGEKVTGLALIVNASSSALIRTAGAFAASNNGERQRIVSIWMTGTSDDRLIKGENWMPKFGKAQASKHYNAEGLVEYHITANFSQEAVIDKNIGWMLETTLK